MAELSDAVGSERISRIIGYKIKAADFRISSPNLPQRIAVIGQANTANQGTLDTDAKQATSLKQVGEDYGFGSPIYQAYRILKPQSGDGVGGIPIFVYPQAAAGGATSKIVEITPSGTATANATHTVLIGGRSNVDAQFYDIAIEEGDTAADITAKISDAVNAVLGAPVLASDTDYVAELETKWKDLTANELSVSVDTNGNDAGITYAVDVTQAGSGTPSISGALDQFGNIWNTIVLNCYGLNATVMSALEAFNGVADPDAPTGRYSGTIMKPFIAISGSVSDDPSATTDARSTQMTIAVAPAPNSAGFSFEAAANMTRLFAVVEQNNPHLDVAGQAYPDMPTPIDIGSMAVYDNRDTIVKKGCSTVDLVNGQYQVQDFVTTFHPTGELIPQFRYCRNIGVDLNVRYGYYLKEQLYVVDHVIANDNDIVTASKVVKPKSWKSNLFDYYDDLTKRGLIVDAQFSKDNTTVELSGTNPDRLNTNFKYKRSGVARISSTTAEAGFNYGNV